MASTTRIKIESIDIDHPIDNCGDDVTRNKSMLGIFVLGLLGGFIAFAYTLRVSHDTADGFFFTKQQSKHKGSIKCIDIWSFPFF